MRKLFTLIFMSVFLIQSCQKNDIETPVKVEPAGPNERIQVLNQVIRVVPAPGLKAFNNAANLGFKFTLVAEVDAPMINNLPVQATHVAIEGNRAFVSYNMQGGQNLGAIDIIDISNPSAPVILKTIIFENRDINTIGFHNGLIVVGGQDAEGAFYGFINPADLHNTLQVHRLISHSTVGFAAGNQRLYFVSAKNGGLTVIDSEGKSEHFPIFDARSVVAGQDVFVLSKDKIRALNGGEIVLDPNHIQNGSKADMAISAKYLFAALNRGGAHVYNASNLSFVHAFPRPQIPLGANAENFVTNSVSVNDPLIFLANGGAGISVNKRATNMQTNQDEFIEFGYFDFGGPLSSNYVMSKGNFIFVATGLGGLKILTFEDADDCNWTPETAFAGSNAGPGSAWWFYFDNSGNSTHPIYAGKKLVEGAFAKYQNGVMTIVLGPKMILSNDSEAVKIQGYNQGQLPLNRPPAGLFTTYKGRNLQIQLPHFDYYIIHLDVLVCN